MPKYRVTLTADERQALEKLVSSGTAAARKLTHARALLLADEGEQGPARTNAAIADALGMGERTIERLRKRFVLESLEAALHPRPQPPRPDKIKIQGPVEKQLIELACSEPPPGQCRWTLQLLADQLVVLGCVDCVSDETVPGVRLRLNVVGHFLQQLTAAADDVHFIRTRRDNQWSPRTIYHASAVRIPTAPTTANEIPGG